jgi:hypothetical protein
MTTAVQAVVVMVAPAGLLQPCGSLENAGKEEGTGSPGLRGSSIGHKDGLGRCPFTSCKRS